MGACWMGRPPARNRVLMCGSAGIRLKSGPRRACPNSPKNPSKPIIFRLTGRNKMTKRNWRKGLQTIFALFKETFNEWNEDKAPRLGAALAFYTVFSLAPLLIIVIAIAGMFFGVEAAQGKIDEQIRGLVGVE